MLYQMCNKILTHDRKSKVTKKLFSDGECDTSSRLAFILAPFLIEHLVFGGNWDTVVST